MEIEYLPLLKDQWLSDTSKFKDGVPSDYIIFKLLPNKGATHGELLIDRHSIIMEFNTPVLEGKRDAKDESGSYLKYPNIKCVYQDETLEDVIDYLKSDIKYKKIFCTSQAYLSKVVPAFEFLGINYHNEFFMLIDECDKLGNDSGFRSEITLPIDDFFKFKNKAMISATAIEPSDPRFEKNGFKILKIQPQWDYRENVTIVNTNNVIFALVTVLESQSENKRFIFLNSVEMIYQIIVLCKLHDHCRVFCSESGVQKLKNDYGFSRAQSTLGNFEPFNFVTSRSFSAVDIELPKEKPDVIMVTHVHRGAFTMLDPYSDSVQIFGRLRKGISSLTHITNFNSELQPKSTEEAKTHIITNVEGYFQAVEAKRKLCEKNVNVEVNVYDEVINGPFKKYVRDGKLNYFMLDNFIHEEKVKGYYRSLSHLEEGYKENGFFIPVIDPKYFTQNDSDILAGAKNESKKTKIERIAEELHKLENKEAGHLIFNFAKNPWNRRVTDPEICEMFDVLKLDGLKRLGFEEHRIKKELIKRKEEAKRLDPKLIKKIHGLYEVGDNPSKKEMSAAIQSIYEKFGLSQKVKPETIQLFFEVKGSTKKKDNGKVHTWVVLEKIYPKN